MKGAWVFTSLILILLVSTTSSYGAESGVGSCSFIQICEEIKSKCVGDGCDVLLSENCADVGRRVCDKVNCSFDAQRFFDFDCTDADLRDIRDELPCEVDVDSESLNSSVPSENLEPEVLEQPGNESEVVEVLEVDNESSELENVSYLKIKDDEEYEVVIDSVEHDEESGELRLEFHHDYDTELPVYVKGDVNYSFDRGSNWLQDFFVLVLSVIGLTEDTKGEGEVFRGGWEHSRLASGGEDVVLVIRDWNNTWFRIQIGNRSEAFEFGVARDFVVKPDVKNGNGKAVNSSFKLKDSLTGKSVKKEDDKEIKVKEGEYDLEIDLEGHAISEINLSYFGAYGGSEQEIKIDEFVNDGFVKSYAIDPSNLNFVNGSVSVVANGTSLYKCRDWNYNARRCEGEWELFRDDLVPGETYTFELTRGDPGFGEILVVDAWHLDKKRDFVSNIYGEIRERDDNWSEIISNKEFARVWYEGNLTNGSVIDVFVRGSGGFDVYGAGGDVLFGSSGEIDSEGEWKYVELGGMSKEADVFDFKVSGSLEFDYIHDAQRILNDDSLIPDRFFMIEEENLTIVGNYSVSGTGGPMGDARLVLNETNSGLLLDTSCDLGDAFEVVSISQILCVGCVDNGDGSIILSNPDNSEQFVLGWNLHSCGNSSAYSPVNFLTQETTSTGAILDYSTGDIVVSSPLTLDIAYPSNGSSYNNPSMFFRAQVEGDSESCWYVFNDAGSVSFTCGEDVNITAVSGINNLTAFVNNSFGYIASDSVQFTLNESIPLTVAITSPASNQTKTDAAPKLKLLAYDRDYSSVNYSLYVYFENDTLYSSMNGTLVNNTEFELILSPSLSLIGNLTTYKILVNATDGVNDASSNILYYTLTLPAITLLSPANNYWSNSGDITFQFSVLDAAFSNVSCSLYIDSILNQTNSTVLSDDTTTTFNVFGISEGASHEWRIDCIDPSNNTGEASRTFNVDRTNPVVNWLNESPEEVSVGEIVNITGNITDNIGVASVVLNVSGLSYYMYHAGGDIYYYEFNTTGYMGVQNYSVSVFDNADNNATDYGNFTVAYESPLVSGLVPVENSTFNVTETIEIAANATDPDGVDKVYANITYPNSTSIFLELTSAGGDKYNSSFTIPALIDRYNVSFYANDSLGNVNNVETTYFNAIDSESPSVYGISPTAGASVNITDVVEVSVNITDDVELSVAYVNITYPNSTVDKMSLSNLQGDKYNTTFNVPTVTGRYNLTFFSNDTSGNENITTSYFYANDTVAPTINISINDTEVEYGVESVRIDFNASDYLLNVTYANVSYPGGALLYKYDNQSADIILGLANLTELGRYNVTVFANDTSGNENVSVSFFYVNDTVAPAVAILSPADGVNSSDSGLDVNYSVSDSNLDSCWYTNDSGATNTTLSSCENITNVIWNEGSTTVRVYANDTSGNENSSSVTFTIDTIAPVISILTPVNGTNSNDNGLDVNYSVTEINLDSCWYTNDSGATNTTLSSCENITNVIWNEGLTVVKIYANDSVGNENSSSVSFNIDTIAPDVNISVNDTEVEFGYESVSIDWNVSNVDLDTAIANVTYPNGTLLQELTNYSIDFVFGPANFTELGRYNITVFANDTSGNENISASYFFVNDTINPSVSGWVPAADASFNVLTSIEVAVNVTDSNSIDSVVANITYPNDTYYELDLSNVPSMDKYNSSFVIPNLGGRYNVTFVVNDSAGNVNDTETTYFHGLTNTSLLAVKFDVSDCSFASSSYVQCAAVNFNTSIPDTHYILMTSMNVKKENNQGSSEIWARVKVDGDTKVEEKIRTVGAAGDEGSTGISPVSFNTSVAAHNITIEFMRTGNGSISVNDIDMNMGQLMSVHGNAARGQYLSGTYTHSSASFVPALNWTVNKTVSSPTFMVIKQTVNASTATIGDYYFEHLGEGDTSPYWSRYFPDSASVGSMSGNFIETVDSLAHNHTVQSRTGTGSITSDFALLDFDLRDSDSHLINNFHVSDSDTNLTSNKTYGGAADSVRLYNVVNETVALQNGTGYFLAATSSFGAVTTGDTGSNVSVRTPRYFINSSDEFVDCYSNKERYLSSDSDIGNVFIYMICDNMTTGNNYTFNLWLEVPQGNGTGYISIVQFDEALSGFEVSEFDIASTNLPPLPNTITNPANNSLINDVVNITWLAFSDPNQDAVTYNVSLYDSGNVFNQAINASTNLTYQLWNSSSVSDGDYIIYVEGCDPSGECSNGSTYFTIDNAAPIISIFVNDTEVEYGVESVRIDFNATDSNLDFVVANVSYPNGTLLQELTNQSVDFVFTPVNLAELGRYNISVFANDTLGNVNVATSFFYVNDTIAPEILILEPADGTNSSDNELDVNYIVSGQQSCWWSNDSGVTNISLPGCVNITTIIWPDGTQNIIIYANDSAGNENSSSVSFTIDTLFPQISILSPIDGTNSSDNGLDVNYIVTEANLDSCWYTNDSGVTNTSLPGCANITSVTWLDGEQNVIVYANDSFGNKNSSGVSFTIDTIAPLISIVSPINGTNSSDNGLDVSYIVSGQQSCWWSNDSGTTNTSLPGCSNITTITWSDGTQTVYIWANDSVGNENRTDVSFTIDTLSPVISILSPIDGTNSSDSGLDVNYIVMEANLDSCWWSNDSGATNTTLVGCENITGVTWPDGDQNVIIYANDSFGNKNSSSVSFIIDATAPVISILSPIDGTNSSDSGLDVNYTVTEANLDSCWYTNDSGTTNTTLSSCENITNVIWNEGSTTVIVYANDSFGNKNSSSVSFTIDTVAPVISILTPVNGTNSSDNGLDVNYSVSDSNLDSCWWSNDSGATNTALLNCANITTVTWSEGVQNVIVYANDSFSNENSSGVTFTIDTIAPYISNVNATSINVSSATIVWDTDEGSNSTVTYRTNVSGANYSYNSSSTTSHSIVLVGLDDNTTYYYNVTSCDVSGNCNTSEEFNFTTLVLDTTAPVISNVSATLISTSGAVIIWSTDEGSNSSVSYRNDSLVSYSYNSSAEVTSHLVRLSGLNDNEAYYYNVTSCDVSGNCNISGEFNFTTLEETVVPGDVCGDGVCGGSESCLTCSEDCGVCPSAAGGVVGDLSGSISKRLALGVKSLVRVNGEFHSLEVLELNESFAVIEIKSNPQVIVLGVGDSENIDLDEDGVYDISIKLNWISGNLVEVEIARISEEIVLELYNIGMELNESVVYSFSDLGVVVSFDSFGANVPVAMSFVVLNEDGVGVYVEEDSVVVDGVAVYSKNFDAELVPGKYTLVLTTLHSGNVAEEFRGEFEVREAVGGVAGITGAVTGLVGDRRLWIVGVILFVVIAWFAVRMMGGKKRKKRLAKKVRHRKVRKLREGRGWLKVIGGGIWRGGGRLVHGLSLSFRRFGRKLGRDVGETGKFLSRAEARETRKVKKWFGGLGRGLRLMVRRFKKWFSRDVERSVDMAKGWVEVRGVEKKVEKREERERAKKKVIGRGRLRLVFRRFVRMFYGAGKEKKFLPKVEMKVEKRENVRGKEGVRVVGRNKLRSMFRRFKKWFSRDVERSVDMAKGWVEVRGVGRKWEEEGGRKEVKRAGKKNGLRQMFRRFVKMFSRVEKERSVLPKVEVKDVGERRKRKVVRVLRPKPKRFRKWFSRDVERSVDMVKDWGEFLVGFLPRIKSYIRFYARRNMARDQLRSLMSSGDADVVSFEEFRREVGNV